MTSTVDSSLSPLQPHYPPPDASGPRNEPPKLQKLIETLHLVAHIEGGYFVETDRDPLRVPNPFLKNGTQQQTSSDQTTFYTSTGCVSADLSDKLTAHDAAAAATASDEELGQEKSGERKNDSTRNASTSIHYLVTPASPLGAFHRNRGRTVHTLHRGRGRYVIIHADEVMPAYDTHHRITQKARVETFIVGQNTEKGERLQWIVEGGKYKASYLLPDVEGGEESEGLLISETVVPGFEYSDHDFMRVERLEALVNREQSDEMRWMLRKDDEPI
ncbi:RmlC-like cupin domain-containing protein [Delphinella strobiligena]|nr:RmlC-like cupin domain-containing protein [Delphinella strobiligena]